MNAKGIGPSHLMCHSYVVEHVVPLSLVFVNKLQKSKVADKTEQNSESTLPKVIIMCKWINLQFLRVPSAYLPKDPKRLSFVITTVMVIIGEVVVHFCKVQQTYPHYIILLSF